MLARAGDDVVVVAPTASRRSLCFQMLALLDYEQFGAVTVVISPLRALIKDQVAALERTGVDAVAPKIRASPRARRPAPRPTRDPSPEQLRTQPVRACVELAVRDLPREMNARDVLGSVARALREHLRNCRGGRREAGTGAIEREAGAVGDGESG